AIRTSSNPHGERTLNMKTARIITFALLYRSTLNLQLSTLFAQGTAFTYSGFLTEQGAPAHGAYDFQFTLYDQAAGGSIIRSPFAVDDLAISNGLFTVVLDFGPASFPGARRFLEIG